MSKFISMVMLLFASMLGCFNLSFTSKADDANPPKPTAIQLAQKAVDDLLHSDIDVYLIIYRFNSNKCFIIGNQRFLRWDPKNDKCQWKRFRTFKRSVYEHLWKFSDFPDIRLLSSNEILSLVRSHPGKDQYVNDFHHSDFWFLRYNTLLQGIDIRI